MGNRFKGFQRPVLPVAGEESTVNLHLEGLYRLNREDVPRAGSVLSQAFRNDPLWRRVFEGVPHFEERFRTFFFTPVLFCLRYGMVYGTSSVLEGIAGMVPGDRSEMTMWRIVRSGAFGPAMKIGMRVAKRMVPIGRAITPDRNTAMKGREYIYLFILGVMPELQGKGHGGKILHTIADACDRAQLPVYLETETEENVRIYERFGFAVVKKIVLEELKVPMWEMVREPRQD
jgi:ribosomal protein S18 acetylase RimI-like enzyme